MQQIYKVDALSGSGKTYQAIRFAIKHAKLDNKIVIVQPSMKLIDQSYGSCFHLAGGSIPVRKIHTDTCNQVSVQRSIMEHLNNDREGGEILFITHAAFLSIPFWPNAWDWNVIFDEFPVIDKDLTLTVPETHWLVTDHISTVSADPTYYQLFSDNDGKLRKISENKKSDATFQLFRDIAEALVSDHWDVYAKKENWHRMMNRDGSGEQSKFICFGLRHSCIFDPFKSVTIMGAMLHDTVMYHWWLSQNVKFIPHPVIQDKVQERMPQHLNGENLDIRYFFEEDWSKRNRDKPVYENGNRIEKFDHIKAKIKAEFGSDSFLWVANKDIDDSCMSEFPNAIRLSNSPHGLNQYQHIHNVVFLSALNPSPAHFGFMASKGISADDLRNAMVHQVTYQAIMRCSLRDVGNTEPKTVMVSDKQTAEWLGSHFSGCSIGQVEHALKITKKQVGRPTIGKKAMSGAERMQRSKKKKEQELLCDETTIYNRGSVTQMGSIFGSIYACEGEQLTHVADTNQFINELRQCHQEAFDSKNANALISPAVFDPDKSDGTSRGLDNITQLWGIWLDNDGGDLSWREFHKKFPDLQMVCMNTWTGYDRYRVFIPTTEFMTLQCHQKVVHYMMDRLEGYYDDKTADLMFKKGRTVKRHGFDTSKLVASSLFYLPCQAENPKHSFFKVFDGNPLDPCEWGVAAITMEEGAESQRPVLMYENDDPIPVTTGKTKMQNIRVQIDKDEPANDNKTKINNAIQMYKDTPSGMKMRNHAFFSLGLKLKGYGLDENEISNHLNEADDDGSRGKKGAISNVLKSLNSGRYD